MDKIWDRKSFEVGGHWPLWGGGDEKTNDHAEPTKEKYTPETNVCKNATEMRCVDAIY